MKKSLAVFITSLLVLAGLVAAPAAQAAGLSAHVYLSDYTPNLDQEIKIYVDGLDAETEYSYGWVFAIDLEIWDGGQAVKPFGQISNFETDENGRAEISQSWWFDSTVENNPYINYSSWAPLKVYVSQLNVTPSSLAETLAISEQVIPGQNSLNPTFSYSGSVIGEDGFVSGSSGTLEISNAGNQYSEFLWILADKSFGESPLDILEFGYANDFSSQNMFFGLGFLSEGNGASGIFIPQGVQPENIIVIFSDSNGERDGTWMSINSKGEVFSSINKHVVASVPAKVREYSYSKIVYGQPDFRDQNNGLQIKTLSNNCFSMGDGIIYMTAGICKWVVKDSEKNVVQRGSTNVVKSASKRNSVWLRHFSVNYKKGKTVVSRAVDSKIRAEWNSDDFYNIVAIGHAWNEGSKKKMKKLSKDRTDAIHDYFTNTYGELSVSTILWGWSGADLPLAKKGKKSAQNRRVEIIEVQPGMWVW